MFQRHSFLILPFWSVMSRLLFLLLLLLHLRFKFRRSKIIKMVFSIYFTHKHHIRYPTKHPQQYVNRIHLFIYIVAKHFFLSSIRDRYMSERLENVCAWSSCHWWCSNFILSLQLRERKYIACIYILHICVLCIVTIVQV